MCLPYRQYDCSNGGLVFHIGTEEDVDQRVKGVKELHRFTM
jgi:hypothetical protein